MKEQSHQGLAFNLYWSLGPGRSLKALHRMIQEDSSLIGLKKAPSLSTLERWSTAFHWQDRMLALERDAREKDRAQLVEQRREMNDRHAKLALAVLQKVVARLSSLSPEELAPRALIEAMRAAVHIERLARGIPTQHVREEGEGVYGHIDLSRFTNEGIGKLLEIAERGAGESSEEGSV